jgi:hypothetical protein
MKTMHFLFITCLSMALILPLSNASASVVNAETDQPIVIGAGYDPAFGVVLDECVEWKKSTEEKPDVSSGDGAKAISYNLSLIENIEDIEKSLGLSASAKYGAISGKASFSSSIKMNSYNVYILVEVKVKNQANTISRISLHEDAVNLANSSNKRFRNICGTEFVVSITKGGQLFGVLEISTNSKTQQQEIKASVKGNMGAFSASADVNKSLKKIVKGKSVKVTLWSSGTRGQTPLPTDVETMLNFASGFPKEAIQFPTSFLAITRPYSQVLNYPEIDIFRVENQRLILERIAKRRLEYIKAANDIDFIIKYPDQFEEYDSSALLSKRKVLLSTIDALSSAGSKCIQSSKECKWSNDQIIQIDLPKRKDGVTMVCKPQQHKNCGVKSYIVKQSAHCRFDLNHGAGAACGVLRYNKGKGAVCGTKLTHSIYMWPHRASGGNKLNLCNSKGYDMTTGRIGCHSGAGHCTPEPHNNEFLECGKYASCEHSTFGAKTYNSCRHESFGKTNKVCAHKEHGVAQYLMCNINLDTGERCE